MEHANANALNGIATIEQNTEAHSYNRRDWAWNSPITKFLVKNGHKHSHWTEHQEVLVNPDKTIEFLSHPYYLDEDDVAQLQLLNSNGWDVWIVKKSSYHENTLEVHVKKTNT